MRTRRLWIILLALAVLTPIGLWLPERLGAGNAWGEWAPGDLGEKVGFIPRGLARISELWKAPAPNYAPAGWERKPTAHRNAAYVVSAIGGVLVTAVIMWGLARLLSRRRRSDASRVGG